MEFLFIPINDWRSLGLLGMIAAPHNAVQTFDEKTCAELTDKTDGLVKCHGGDNDDGTIFGIDHGYPSSPPPAVMTRPQPPGKAAEVENVDDSGSPVIPLIFLGLIVVLGFVLVASAISIRRRQTSYSEI